MRTRHLLSLLALAALVQGVRAQRSIDLLSELSQPLAPEDRIDVTARAAEALYAERRTEEAQDLAHVGFNAAVALDLAEATSTCARVLGQVALDADDRSTALTFAFRAVLTGEEAGVRHKARASLLLARIYARWGFAERAVSQAREALASGVLEGEEIYHAEHILLSAARNSGHVNEATAAFDRMLAIARSSNDPQVQRECLHGLSRLALEGGDARAALNYLSEELVIAQAHADEHEIGVLFNDLGELQQQLDRPQEALSAYSRSASMLMDRPDLRDRVLLNWSIALGRVGLFTQAHDMLESVIQRHSPAPSGLILARAHVINGGLFLLDGQNREAEAQGRSALLAADANADVDGALEAIDLLTRVADDQGREDKARDLAQMAHDRRAAQDDLKRKEARRRLESAYQWQQEENDIMAAISAEQRDRMQLRQTILLAETQGQQVDIEQYKADLEASFRQQEALLKERSAQALALAQAALEAEKSAHEINGLQSQRELQLLQLSKLDLEQKQKQTKLEMLKKQNDLLESDRMLQAANQRRDRLITRTATGAAVIAALFLLAALWGRRKLKAKSRIIATQMDQIGVINDELSRKNTDMMDSINYARNIQRTIITTQRDLDETLPGSFLFYRPRDVVSGDLPFLLDTPDRIFLAAIDCTGHGVPAAMLSFIAYFNLNEILNSRPDLPLDQVLAELHRRVIQRVGRNDDGQQLADGMDIGLCGIDKRDGSLSFSGAGIGAIVRRDGVTDRIRGDRRGVGDRSSEEAPVFTEHRFLPGEALHCYLYSDGMIHQFGGTDGRSKLSNRKLIHHLMELDQRSGKEAVASVAHLFDSWKGDTEQTDDALLIGFSPLTAVRAIAA